mmetsp:Transcript_29016/g.48755  ORF Transcript_29016/g.48755 Transcript_29016/m.48755 type:complete len:508 (-) Transcript_29016:745-2268(-)
MSRSALQKAHLKNIQKAQSQRMMQVSHSVGPPAMLGGDQSGHSWQNQYYMYGGVASQQPTMPTNNIVQPFVPIALTGDEDDNDPNALSANALPMHGNTSNYNINNLLYNNIMENDYFRALYQLRTYHEVLDEIYRSVDHVEPWQTNTRFPSTAFCLMVKFMLMKLTRKQMNGLLNISDCSYIRAIALLYLRYTCPPTDLWKWYEPFLEDEEEITPCADKKIVMSIGQYCVKLLTDMQYYGTTLPRIPVPIERKMKVMLLLLEEKKKRRQNNMRDKDRGLFAPGTNVRAIYSDAENEPAWYEAVIDSMDKDSENMYWVTFPEYGNTECVDLGDMELSSSNSANSGTDKTAATGATKSSVTTGRDRNMKSHHTGINSDSEGEIRERGDSRDRRSSSSSSSNHYNRQRQHRHGRLPLLLVRGLLWRRKHKALLKWSIHLLHRYSRDQVQQWLGSSLLLPPRQRQHSRWLRGMLTPHLPILHVNHNLAYSYHPLQLSTHPLQPPPAVFLLG